MKLEREMLKPMRESSDYVIDTSLVSPAQLRSRIAQLFLNSAEDSLAVHCISFGFKYGVPMESDLVFDVRCLPNPFYDEKLRPLTGLDAPVRDYVMEKEETKGFVARFTDMVDYLLPLYAKEGKSQLVIAVGCTGGHHRSVALASTCTTTWCRRACGPASPTGICRSTRQGGRPMKLYTIIGGVNGCGKSSLTGALKANAPTWGLSSTGIGPAP